MNELIIQIVFTTIIAMWPSVVVPHKDMRAAFEVLY